MSTVDDVHEQAKALVAILDSAGTVQVPIERHSHTLLAFAAVSRCRSLLLGTIELDRSGRSDILGVTVRALVEVWYFGVIALLGTDDDLVRFEQDHRYWKNDLAKQFHGVQPDDRPVKKFSVYERAKRADELVRGVGQPAGVALDVYRGLYAGESLTSAHAGYESLKSYVAEQPDGTIGVVREPEPDSAHYHRLRMALVLTAYLAKWTWEEAGLDSARFDELSIDEPQSAPMSPD
jgi:hypothetical protein